MSSKRKHVSFLRTAGSLLLAAGLSYGLLRLADLLIKRQLDQSAMTPAFFVLAGISAFFLFVLLVFPANRPLRSLKVFTRWALIVVGVLVIWGAGSLWNLQNEMIYIPDGYDPASEARAQAVPGLEAVTVQGRDGHYRGWLWKNTPDKAGLVLYFGGNAQYAAQSMAGLAQSPGSAQVFEGYHVLMMDYPGYGQSEGIPGEDSIYRMALAVWDQMAAREDVERGLMVPMGWSIGSGTAARLAAEKQPAGLILMAPFYDGGQLINSFVRAPLIQGVIENLVRNKYKNYEYARLTQAKALIIAASGDQVIPPEQAKRLAETYPQHNLVMVDGGHGEAWSSPGAYQAVREYLQGLLLP